jgi:uncharacterized protein YkwD
MVLSKSVRTQRQISSISIKKNIPKIIIIGLICIGLFIIPRIFSPKDIELSKENNQTITSGIPEYSKSDTSNSSFAELIEYTLFLINAARSKNNISEVNLNDIQSAQLHAENMLNVGFFSHWNLEGEKPYMRYSKNGGNGIVSENIGWIRFSGTLDPKKAINHSLYQMLYEDSSWQWVHRDNILNPMNNQVDLGIAYNETCLYLVLDFEAEYFEVFEIEQNDSRFRLTAVSEIKNWIPSKIQIQFDPLPSLLTKQIINKKPYSEQYDSGKYIGTIIPKNYDSIDLFPIRAEKWLTTQYSWEVTFDLRKVFELYGEGVYTLYIFEDDRFWSSRSFWYFN